MEQIPLFDKLAVVQWLPGETLFSLASRIHLLSGRKQSKETCIQLFGNRTSGILPDLPAGIDTFVARTNGLLGEANEIIRWRTILHYFLPFRSMEIQEFAVNTLRGSQTGSLKYRLGLLTSGVGANHPLKACAECMRVDVASYGVAYWRTTHQLPGACACALHQVQLTETGLDRRYEYRMPNSNYHIVLDAPASISEMHLRFTDVNENLYQFDSKLNTNKLRIAYHYRLKELGLFRGSGLRASTIEKECKSALKGIHDYQICAVIKNSDWPVSIIRRPERGRHPLKHALLISWLFNSWTDFISLYKHVIETEDEFSVSPKHSGLKEAADNGKTEIFLGLMRGEGISVSEAARRASLSKYRALMAAQQADLPIARRPKQMKENVVDLICRDLLEGEPKLATAEKYKVTTQAISRLLQRFPAVAERWRMVQFEKDRSRIRTEWLRVREEHGWASLTCLRALASKEYAWLYRNDAMWLKDSIQQKPSSKQRGRYVDWGARDEQLSKQVQQIALRFSLSNEPLRMEQLCRALPDLKRYWSTLDRLPLTNQKLSEILKRRKGRS